MRVRDVSGVDRSTAQLVRSAHAFLPPERVALTFAIPFFLFSGKAINLAQALQRDTLDVLAARLLIGRYLYVQIGLPLRVLSSPSSRPLIPARHLPLVSSFDARPKVSPLSPRLSSSVSTETEPISVSRILARSSCDGDSGRTPCTPTALLHFSSVDPPSSPLPHTTPVLRQT